MDNQGQPETPIKRPPPTKRRPPSKPGGGGLLTLVFAVLAVLGGVAAWPSIHSALTQLHLDRLGGPTDAGSQATLNAPSAAFDTAQPPVQPVDRIDRLEAAAMTAAMRIESLERRLQSAEDALKSTPAGGDSGQAKRIGQELAQLRQDLDEVAGRRSSDGKDRSSLLVLALGQLKEAVDRGAPYQTELKAAALMVAANPDQPTLQRLSVLQGFAAQGIDTRVALALKFRDIAAASLRESSMADASPQVGRVLQWLGSAITVRRSDGDAAPGSVSGAIVQAGRLTAAGDLNAAVKLLQSVQGPGTESLQGWLKAASGRVAADAALSELSAAAIAKTAAGDQGP